MDQNDTGVLSEVLARLELDDPVVAALPQGRGLAEEVARRLDVACLEVPVHAVLSPANDDVVVGVVSPVETRVVPPATLRAVAVDPDSAAAMADEERRHLRGAGLPDVEGRSAAIVADAATNPLVLETAGRLLREAGARSVVVVAARCTGAVADDPIPGIDGLICGHFGSPGHDHGPGPAPSG